VDLVINGSYRLGAAGGAIGALVLLDTSIFAPDIAWRLAFAIGAVLGLGILLVRRHVPESLRWLFIHGRDEEAELIVGEMEEEVRSETGQELDEEPGEPITVRQRKSVSFREIASTAFSKYPRRTALSFALFVGQAFIYNAVTFGLGTFLVSFYDIDDARVPVYIGLFAVSNFLGPVLLGRLFDTVGRKPMIGRQLSRVGGGAVRADDPLPRRVARRLGLHGAAARHVLPRVGGRRLRVPHGLGDLPDGDARAGDRVSSTPPARPWAASPARSCSGR
jgi:MFS family permease